MRVAAGIGVVLLSYGLTLQGCAGGLTARRHETPETTLPAPGARLQGEKGTVPESRRAVPEFPVEQTVSATSYQGFGTPTLGGKGGRIVTVTTLNDSGPGSLRDAVKQSNRTVVFAVSGRIVLANAIKVKGAFLTVDGFSAPPPGITLVNAGLYISGKKGGHDLIIRGLRIRDPRPDGITIRDGASNIVIDHVSIQGAYDGSLDITRGAFDVTVQWSILAQNVPTHNLLSLIEYQAHRITFHHNLFMQGQSRQPQSGWEAAVVTPPPEVVTDIRNNLIWDFGAYGTVIKNNTRANVVQNFYYSSTQPGARHALNVRSGQVYAQGNYSRNGADVDSQGNQPHPFPAAPVETTDACTAAQQVRNTAGARPLDALDEYYLALIRLPSAPCPGSEAVDAAPAGGKSRRRVR